MQPIAKRLLVNVSVFGLALLVTLLLAELAVRLLVKESAYRFYNVADDWATDDTLGWQNKPHYLSENYLLGQRVRFATNEDGLRPASVHRTRKTAVKRVLMVGNSTVAGRAVPETETIHYYLDSLLNLGGTKYEVVNAAVEGYATDQALLMLERQLVKYRPDIVTYGFCNNDLFGNLRQKDAGLNKPYFTRSDGVPRLHLPAKNTKINALRNKFIEQRILANSALFGYLRPSIYRLRVKLSSQLAEVEGVDPVVYTQQDQHRQAFDLFEQLVVEMSNFCRFNNAQFLMYAHPDLKAVWEPYRQALGIVAPPSFCEDALAQIAEANGVHFVRMVERFREKKDEGPFHLLPLDGHCNGNGYQLQAAILADAIGKAGPLQD